MGRKCPREPVDDCNAEPYELLLLLYRLFVQVGFRYEVWLFIFSLLRRPMFKRLSLPGREA